MKDFTFKWWYALVGLVLSALLVFFIWLSLPRVQNRFAAWKSSTIGQNYLVKLYSGGRMVESWYSKHANIDDDGSAGYIFNCRGLQVRVMGDVVAEPVSELTDRSQLDAAIKCN